MKLTTTAGCELVGISRRSDQQNEIDVSQRTPTRFPVFISLTVVCFPVIAVNIRYTRVSGSQCNGVTVPTLPCCQSCIAIWVFVGIRRSCQMTPPLKLGAFTG